MRTTLTLDDDVAARLEQLRAEDQRSFKELVNAVLRRGLDADDPPDDAGGPFTEPVSLGASRLPVDDVSALLEQIEGEQRR